MKNSSIKIGIMAIASVTLMAGTTACNRKGCTDPLAKNYNEKAKKDDGSCTYYVDPYLKSGSITANETWTNDHVYTIAGKVVIEDGVTLTIEPGAIIKAQEGAGSNASALVVAQGGKLNAVGTASQPIIFTSVLDNIQIGQLTGTNLTEIDNGLWGGVIVLGRAPISAANGDVVSQIEGIPVSEAYGAFGGSDPADNSGHLEYISIRHGGEDLSAGKEINGLTLGGVGSGTTITNIEIVANYDDGVEFFGGTVDATNIIVAFQGDDGVDIDMNYSGTVDNFLVINGSGSDEALEIDGPEGTTYTNGLFNLMNGTVYTYGGTAARSEFKSKAQGAVTNLKTDGLHIRTSYENDCSTPKTDAFTHLTAGSPTLTFATTEFNSITVFTSSNDGVPNPIDPTPCTVVSSEQTAAEAAVSSAAATGATTSTFDAWTWCSVNGKL